MAHHQAKLEVFYDGCPYNLLAIEKYELTSIQRHNEIKGNGDEALVL
jgi:hypothetical protein